jgi:ribonucleotide reductase alpha subunit
MKRLPKAGDLSGSLLVAHPMMADPNFRHAILYLSHHSAEDGALGFILNRPLGQNAGELGVEEMLEQVANVPLFEGGPVHKNQIIVANGSIQEIPGIPDHIKALYKTVWEIKQRTIVDMAADRGPFICQSQSLNIHMADPNFAKLTSLHFHAWKRGLKTGMYYLRSKAATEAIKFTIDKTAMEHPVLTAPTNQSKTPTVDLPTTEAELSPRIMLNSVENPDQVLLPVSAGLSASAASQTITERMAEIACALDDPDSCISCSG